MQEVVKSLKAIIFGENNDEIDSFIHSENKAGLLKKTTSYSASSDIACMHSNHSELFISKLMQEFNLELIDTEFNSQILNQAEKLFLEIFDIADSINVLIDKIIELLIKTQNEGNNFNETEHFINQCIFLSNRTSNDIFEWLKENQVESRYIFFLGFFYFSNINFEKNDKEAFKLFLKVSEDNYPIAQVYLAKCYKEGFGTERNDKLAFNWIQKAVENESICGQLDFGFYYENSIGTDMDLNKAFYWYNKAANNRNLSRLYNLGRCYELGKGIEKCESKAFEIYKALSEKEYIHGKYRLGICYYFGIGTNIDKENAFKICKYLAEKEYINAQTFIGYLYENGEGTKKDLEKAIYWYNKAAENKKEVEKYNLC